MPLPGRGTRLTERPFGESLVQENLSFYRSFWGLKAWGPSTPRSAEDTMNLIEIREQHYEKFIGPIPNDVYHSTDVKPVHIDIYTFKPTEDRPYYTLITGGMSDKRQNIPDKFPNISKRTEIMTYAHEPKGWMYNVIKGLAEMPWDDDTWLHWYHSMPNGKPMTAEPSALTAFFIVPPYYEDEKFGPMIVEGDKTEFLFMVPITEEELKFKRERGAEDLLKLFDEVNFDYIIDESRKSFV